MDKKEFINEIKKYKQFALNDYRKSNITIDEEKQKILIDSLIELDTYLKQEENGTDYMYHKTSFDLAVEIITNGQFIALIKEEQFGHYEQKVMKENAEILKLMAIDKWEERKKQGIKSAKVLEDLYQKKSEVLEELSKDNKPKVYFSDFIEYGYNLVDINKNFNVRFKGTVIFILDRKELKLTKRDSYVDFKGGIITGYNVPENAPRYVFDFLESVEGEMIGSEFTSYEDVPLKHVKYIAFISKYNVLNVYELIEGQYKQIEFSK